MAEVTEIEWLTGTKPNVLLWAVYRTSPRKERLFCTACCRRVWDLLPVALRRAVEVAELFADGQATDRMLEEAHRCPDPASVSEPEWEAARAIRAATMPYPVMDECRRYTDSTLCCHAHDIRYSGDNSNDCVEAMYAVEAEEQMAQCVLLRDIFGSPFRPVTFSPAWRPTTAVALARTMYESREFSAMPILADALQDAGCDNEDILSHCRDVNQVHVRGCWVVDLVLGRS